jgi:hypothetical protein
VWIPEPVWTLLSSNIVAYLIHIHENSNPSIVIKEGVIGRACSTNGVKRNAYRVLVGRPQGKRPLGRPRCRWVDNVKMDLREIGWSGIGLDRSGSG